MALKATIFKAELQISDMDRGYYQTHLLTIARHPSENDERMMARLLVFSLHAHEDLQFTKGLSTDNEPDLWQRTLNNDIEFWIELGQPDEKRIRKACGRAKQVVIYTYQDRSAEVWWKQMSSKLERFDNLGVIQLPQQAVQRLSKLAQRSMQLQASIQDSQVWFGNVVNSVHIVLKRLK
ncbi:YaeQ family protein [Kaarinaea lacus]